MVNMQNMGLFDEFNADSFDGTEDIERYFTSAPLEDVPIDFTILNMAAHYPIDPPQTFHASEFYQPLLPPEMPMPILQPVLPVEETPQPDKLSTLPESIRAILPMMNPPVETIATVVSEPAPVIEPEPVQVPAPIQEIPKDQVPEQKAIDTSYDDFEVVEEEPEEEIEEVYEEELKEPEPNITDDYDNYEVVEDEDIEINSE